MCCLRFAVLLLLISIGLSGCGEPKTVIPTAEFTEEQKKAIMAEDAKIAEQESHGKTKK
jgi:hypothetical protein